MAQTLLPNSFPKSPKKHGVIFDFKETLTAHAYPDIKNLDDVEEIIGYFGGPERVAALEYTLKNFQKRNIDVMISSREEGEIISGMLEKLNIADCFDIIDGKENNEKIDAVKKFVREHETVWYFACKHDSRISDLHKKVQTFQSITDRGKGEACWTAKHWDELSSLLLHRGLPVYLKEVQTNQSERAFGAFCWVNSAWVKHNQKNITHGREWWNNNIKTFSTDTKMDKHAGEIQQVAAVLRTEFFYLWLKSEEDKVTFPQRLSTTRIVTNFDKNYLPTLKMLQKAWQQFLKDIRDQFDKTEFKAD